MARPALARSVRGGVLLDGFLAVGLLLLGGFALDRLGLTLGEIVRGASQFFGS